MLSDELSAYGKKETKEKGKKWLLMQLWYTFLIVCFKFCLITVQNHDVVIWYWFMTLHCYQHKLLFPLQVWDNLFWPQFISKTVDCTLKILWIKQVIIRER